MPDPIRKRETKEEAIRAALIEAEKGEFIASAAMRRWINSWGTDNELPPPELDLFPRDKGTAESGI
jgi:RHH-type rel operon transcriptional repressor/antitoxin RelB